MNETDIGNSVGIQPTVQNDMSAIQNNMIAQNSMSAIQNNMTAQNEIQSVRNITNSIEKEESKLQKEFHFFGPGCIIYGILFTVCLYKGFHGITMPILGAATMILLVLSLNRLEITVKKSAWFYFAAWEILSVSSCLTGSGVLIFFNTCGMILLVLSFLFTHFCHTKNWGFGKYLQEIFLAPFISIGYCAYPFKAAAAYFEKRAKEKDKNSKAKYIWLGIFISIPLLLVVVSLLVSADAVFRNLFTELFSNIRMPERPVYLCLLIIFGIIGTYSLLAYFAEGKIVDQVVQKEKWEPITAITFLSIITIVYLIFSVIQVSYLFIGGFRLPDGYTYAGYAREGFFQLLFVCMINLVIVLICIARFRENKLLKVIMTLFSCCTFIMIASSAMRMILYVQTYQLTFLRVLVLWALVVISLLLIGCMVTIYKNSFPLFPYAMVVVTVLYIGFSLAKPDYWIAKYNLSNEELADRAYLYGLSTDAVPAMEQAGMFLQEGDTEYYWGDPWRECKDMGILDFNFSYYQAREILGIR